MAITPDDIESKGTESAIQTAFFCWRATHKHLHPGLLWVHHVPNGGARGDNAKSRMIRGAKLKAEGVLSGVHDIFVPYPSKGFGGLYIEVKVPYEKLTDEQSKFAEYCKIHGNFATTTCYSWREIARAIMHYLTDKVDNSTK